MIKHILIAGGAIALMTTPAYAGGSPPSTGSGNLLQCLGCPGLLTPGSGGSPIVAGNLKATVKAHVGAGAGTGTQGNLLNVSAKAGAKAHLGTRTNVSAALKAKASLPSINLGGADCP